MDARTLLPRAHSRLLLAVVLMLVALCAWESVHLLIGLVSQPDWGAFIMAAAWSLLGVGLWRLHPAARWISVILLWMLIVVLIGGVINPFTAGDQIAEHGTAPSVWMLVAWITPAIAVSLAILHILGKHKGEFGRKHDALQREKKDK